MSQYGTAKSANARTRAMAACTAELVELAAERYGRERSGPQSQEEHDAMPEAARAELAIWWQESDNRVRQTAARHSPKLGWDTCQKLWAQAQEAVRTA